MAIDNFIPEVWSAQLLQALDKAHVYASPMVINRDYEGEISAMGDTVRINSVGDITVSSYTKGTPISDPEELVGTEQTLVIDQAKYFNFHVHDLDSAQQNPKVMGEAMRRSAYKLRDSIDTYIASLYSDAALTSGLGTDASALVPSTNTSGTTVYDYFVDMGVLLDENDCPSQDRFVVIPPWVHGRLLKDNRFVNYGTDMNRQTAAEGNVGRAAGFEVMVSNNVPNTSGALYKVIAGHYSAWSFASNLTEIQAYRPEAHFSDAVKGLAVYGAKVVRPNCLALATMSKS